MISRDIIIIGQQAWDTDIGSNCKNIALELSKNNRVLYVNSPLDRITLYKKRAEPKVQQRIAVIKGKQSGLVKIQENLWNFYPDCLVESINWIKNEHLFNYLNKRNNIKFAESIAKGIKALDFKDYLLFNDNEIFKGFYLNKLLKPFLSIYYSRDYMLAVDYWKRHGERLEPLLIASNDICMANSVYLADYCKQYNENSYDIGQGCDLEIFKEDLAAEKPLELRAINTPIIGYVGALQSIRLDIELITFIARKRKDWTIVLVGPEDDQFKNSELHQLPNVVFTGIKPMESLPLYMQYFDVCINPQLVNQVTIGNYPRKVDEYLAMGKPTVATETRAMEIFKDHVYLAQSKEDYITHIEKALTTDTPALQEERKSFAASHSWENCILKMNQAIQLTIDKK
ncbi:glycosyltransferase [Pedobacter gandavensis]|uniref:Glycosyltransferase n=1 Tax=Pedobacter gandavensis TaxID=2679963 RepID=A0ABR6ET81_9SPHI|nr:glycosyltransferase [Pedobacter gandavensis]MBB2148421.1 glycosyltransferase [Pedobacter gandavensis]